jgi:hypothetical protein
MNDVRIWTLIVFSCGLFALLLGASNRLLQDPDTQWHIAVGEQIWLTKSLPTVDEFSHTFAGASWIAKEWLAQLILSRAYAIGGWAGVAVLAAVMVTAAFTVLLYSLTRRVKTTVALIIVLLAILPTMGQFVARPLIFSFVLLALWLEGLIGAVERKSAPPLWLLLVIALWANLHASFPVALVIAGIVGLEAIVSAPSQERGRTTQQWLLFGLAAAAVTGMTPYGFEGVLVNLKVFGGNEAVPYIGEWQPLRLDAVGLVKIVALVGVLAALLSSRSAMPRILLVAVCGALMVRHVRFGGLFAFVGAAAVAGPLARHFPAIQPDAECVPQRARKVLTLSVLPFVLLAFNLVAIVRPAPSQQIAPAAALQAARDAGLTGPVFNSYNFGGFLIHEGVRTFIDGRTDQLFLGGFTDALYTALSAHRAGSFIEILDRHNVSWAIVEQQSAASIKLRSLNWRLVHRDASAAVYARPR